MNRKAPIRCVVALLLTAPLRAPLVAQLAPPPPPPPRPTPLRWQSFPIDLTGPARRGAYVGAIGRRAAALGDETGLFEVWTWPLKLLHGFELEFRTPLSDQPLRGRDLARTVSVTPAGVTIVYTHSAFTVRQRVFAPLDEPAVAMVLEVDAVRPLQIVAQFRPDLQYAWPGSLGGQYAAWDSREKAFLLSESRRQVNAFVGSPWATWATNAPAHMLQEAPNAIVIAVGDEGPVEMPRHGEPVGRLTRVRAAGIPIVFAGAAAPRDSVRALYRRVLERVEALYDVRAAHARRVLDSTVLLHSPDSLLDLALRWANVNLDEAFVCNPDLGCGLVAGYGPSGAASTRPGFAWFFGGDAAINALAMHSTGLLDVARHGLAFFARYQGASGPTDGKIPHEISQSAGRIRWFEDYPYAFYHGDTTPFWILALADHWKATADTTTLRRLWPNIRRGYVWARGTDGDGDGLMDNRLAGAGAIEVGDLQLGLKSDVYLAGVWVAALAALPDLAAAMGDRRTADEARALYRKALAALREKLWLPRAGRYGFALLEGDSLSDQLTIWPATAMSFGLFDETRGQATARSLARATLTTDWGARALAAESPLFDPLHYNNGTVWPFVTGWDAWALYRYHNATAGFAALHSVARTTFVWGLGRSPEVFSGSSYEPLETAVPHQFFATSMLVTPLVRGLLGWEADAPHRRATLAPHLPAGWDSVRVERLPAGSGRYAVAVRRDAGGTSVVVQRTGGRGVDTLVFSPALPLGAAVDAVRVNGGTLACPVRATGRDLHLECRFALGERADIRVSHSLGWEVRLPPPEPERGARSAALKLLDQRLAGDTLVLEVEGLAGKTYTVSVRGPDGEAAAVRVVIPEPGGPVDDYARQVVRVLPGPRPAGREP